LINEIRAAQIRSSDLSGIPSLRTQAVKSTATRGEALRLMEEKGSAELPVVDENDVFVGVLDRDKLTSSIVADLITRQLTE
jgi:CBS domain-containing protein